MSTKEELHFRRIDMRGFRRSDELYEVEGRVTDSKPYDFVPGGGGRPVAANQPIHDMGVRLVFDEDLVVHDVHTFSEAYPYVECAGGGSARQSLKGLRMASGWTKEVRSRLGGGRSCTHLMELLTPLATAAIQSLSIVKKNPPEPMDASGRPRKIDSCYAYAAERELVRIHWPAFHRPAPRER